MKKFKFLISIFVLFLITAKLECCLPRSGPRNGPILSIEQGKIQGVVHSLSSGKKYNAFLGIPYGNAKIRFAAPEKADSWTGIKDGSIDGPPCIQPALSVPPTNGVEDCLTLSVFTTNLNGPALPVLVFFYGGGFFIGNSYAYGVQRYFESTDMVIVFMNYRLSAMGFLSTGDSASPGNYGLLDQNLALHWIQQNIESFNGNPNMVTINGESAGSVSVIAHLLSPKSTGLFHRAIAESGSILNGWALEENPRKYAQILGKKMSCPVVKDSVLLINCLREKSANEIVAGSLEVMIEYLALCFVPVVEPIGADNFLTENPSTLLAEGRFNRVPIIIGFARSEGGIVYHYIEKLMSNIDDYFFDSVLPLLIEVGTDYNTNLLDISYAIKEQYYSDIDISNSSQVAQAGINVIGDMIIIQGSVKTIDFLSRYVPTRMYEFNYDGDWSFDYIFGKAEATHRIETIYLFNRTDIPTLNTKDSNFSSSLVSLWANFIAFGNPTPNGFPVEWLPTPGGQTNFLSINQPYQIIDQFQPSRVNFWFNIVPAIAAN